MKRVKNSIFWFILGAVIFTSLGVIAANMVNAREVIYRDTNVETAIDDLYSKTSSTVEYIYSGQEDVNELFSYSATASFYWNTLKTCTDENALCMNIANANNIMASYTNDLIDFSDYKYILVEYSLYNNHDSLINTTYFGVTDTKDTRLDNFIKSGSVIQVGQTRRTGIMCIDISDVSGQHYFKIAVHHGSNVSDYDSYTRVKSIKLVK